MHFQNRFPYLMGSQLAAQAGGGASFSVFTASTHGR